MSKTMIKRSPRRRRNTSVWISVEGASKKYECTVVNVSDDGMRLLLNPELTDLTTFQLSRVPKSSLKETCEAVWRQGRTIGIKFAR